LRFSSNPSTLERMKGSSILLVAAAVGAGTFAFSRPAAALGPIDLEVGARVGYGSNPIKGDPANPLGVGLGARAGMSFFSIYAGVNIQYYFGGSGQVPDPNNVGATTKDSQHSLLYGVEGGYSFDILILKLRPVIGVGNYTLHSSVIGDTHNIYIQPGAMALIGLGLWYFGADGSVLLTPGMPSSQAAFTVNGQVGLKF
jgi:hypothetical protein